MDKNQFDIKMLSLKRWNAPQPKALFEQSGVKYGDFISFRSYHFVDIKDVSYEIQNPALLGTYEALSEMRSAYQNITMQDTHIVQTMPLLGHKTVFWDTPIDVMYITFVQLSEVGSVPYDVLSSAISNYIAKRLHSRKNKPQFALYQALDFCDYVLFTKDITMTQLQDLLWELSLIRQIGDAKIRDTFTIYGFGWDYLKKSFEDINYAKWNDTVVANINVSIQSLQVFKDLCESLKSSKIHFSKKRMCGRYDITLTTGKLTGKNFIKILKIIDDFCHTINNDFEVSETCPPRLGGYEIILTSPMKSQNKAGNQPKMNTELSESAVFYLESWTTQHARQLHKAKGQEINKIANYIHETICSLKELLKNGFVDEFVLSVLPSFISFLEISLKYSHECELLKRNKTTDSIHLDTYRRIKASLHSMWRQYFTALNTLSLCTMHSERQFIQAPAFNASYFEVPPKLLAYYSAITNDLAHSLNYPGATIPYRFVITPDFRDDINVKPLPIYGQEETSVHLAIINLNEAFIYKPITATLLLAHEVAHFVGDRKRELRAKLIFKAVSLKLIRHTPFISIVNTQEKHIKNDDIVALVSDIIGDFLLARYIDYPKEDPLYYSQSIIHFLNHTNYGLDYMRNPYIRTQLAATITQELNAYCPKNSNILEQLSLCLQSMETTLQTTYYTDLLQSDPTNIAPYAVFAQKIIVFLFELGESEVSPSHLRPLDSIRKYLNEVVYSFFEAYADYKMYELCDWDENTLSLLNETYKELLNQLSGKAELQRRLRHDSVMLNIMQKANHINCTSESDKIEEIIQQRIVLYITEYIDSCKNPQCTSPLAKRTILVFSNDDLQKQYEQICDVILAYRDCVIEECKEHAISLLSNTPQKNARFDEYAGHG